MYTDTILFLNGGICAFLTMVFVVYLFVSLKRSRVYRVKISKLKPIISDALAKKGAYTNDNYRFISNGVCLNDTDTLFDAGVWDGSNLAVV